MLPTILNQISIWVIVIPFLIGLMNFRWLNRDSRWIFFSVSLAMVPQLVTAFTVTEDLRFNLSYNLFIPVDFAILYAVFITKYRRGVGKLAVQVLSVAYALTCAYFFLRYGLERRFLHELVCIANIVFMLWVLLLLRQEFMAADTLIVRSNPFTWYFVAIALHSPCRVATLALYYYIRDPEANPIRLYLTVIDSGFNILLYLLFSVGLLFRKNTLKVL